MKAAARLLWAGGKTSRDEVMEALPYVTLGPWSLGPLTIHSFGVLVAIGVMVAHTIAQNRAVTLGQSKAKMGSLLGWMLLAGFVGGHVFNVLMYEPRTILTEPWKLFWILGSLSSYGGILGALIGIALWKRRNPDVVLAPFLDAAAFSLPVGWLFGRMGCALVHDHPGRTTDFPLAVDFGTHGLGGIRHDLGLYEAAWWLVVVAVFFALDKAKPALRQPPGFYLAFLPLIYAPVRFGLDFLRIPPEQGGDARYFGLTPAQYLSLTFFVVGIVLMTRWRRRSKAGAPEAALVVEGDGHSPIAGA